MNYRHAYHAGNFADCLKHAVLVAILRALLRKPAPFRVLDTHAGRGLYDLSGAEAQKTGEWREGIGRLLGADPPELADYLGLVRTAGAPVFYPGSPVLVRALLRPTDRLVANEMHPDEHAALAAHFAGDRSVTLRCQDSAEALRATIPFPEGRGLILIDPPFEVPDEFARCRVLLETTQRRFGHAVVALWYPIKHRAPVRAFFDSVPPGNSVAVELLLREPIDPTRLNGCGMLLVNPPWSAMADLGRVTEALGREFGALRAGLVQR